MPSDLSLEPGGVDTQRVEVHGQRAVADDCVPDDGASALAQLPGKVNERGIDAGIDELRQLHDERCIPGGDDPDRLHCARRISSPRAP